MNYLIKKATLVNEDGISGGAAAADEVVQPVERGERGHLLRVPIEVERAGARAAGSVAASDAFFPFADGPQVLLDAGVSAIVQPGGSIRDEEVFEAARKAGITMYVTGTRHFFH